MYETIIAYSTLKFFSLAKLFDGLTAARGRNSIWLGMKKDGDEDDDDFAQNFEKKKQEETSNCPPRKETNADPFGSTRISL